MRGEIKKRAYSSALRTEQALQTRTRVITAAQQLFLERGYPKSTITAIAERSGVAADTVYHLFGSKSALLKEVLDVAIAGDDADQAVLDREEPQAMRAEPNQRKQLALFAAGMSRQLERVRPIDDILRTAAAADTDAAELRADLQLRQRRSAMTTVVEWIAERGPLRDGTTIEHGAAIVWTLTSSEVHQMLRDVWGWSAQNYRDWLGDSLTYALLPDPPGRRREKSHSSTQR
jgi:AcrR family transcriptional regulator